MLIESFIKDLTKQEGCARVASTILEETAHLIKARSVAVGAAKCIFNARLVEVFGASGFLQSIIPGKGSLVHQILAIAFPRAFIDSEDPRKCVDDAIEKLEDAGVLIEPSSTLIANAKSDAIKMLETALLEIPEIAERINLDVNKARVYTETQLMSCRLHVWGILDALVEDRTNRRAIVIDWKTSEEAKAPQIYEPDIAQVTIYAMLVAERLGFDDPRYPVKNGYIVPVIIRPRGRNLVSSLSPAYPTISRRYDISELLDRCILAAEHLTLLVSDVRKFAGTFYDRICRYDSGGGIRASAFRKVPPGLPRGNPHNEDKFPCKVCFLRSECKFYIATFEDPEEMDKLAFKARLATHSVRENALMPYKEVYEIFKSGFDPQIFEFGGIFTLERSGNRVDIFKEAYVENDLIIVRRKLRENEIEEGRIISVREGKPVATFFNEDIPNPLLRLCVVGRVEEVRLDGDDVIVSIGMPNIPSKLQPILFGYYLRKWFELGDEVLAIETNVDLTQMELKAIDAYHRGTKLKIKSLKTEIKNAKEEALEILFGKPPEWWF